MRAIALVALFVAAVTAAPSSSNDRIIGGSLTTINVYPDMASLQYSATGLSFSHSCGGIILNQQNILTAAHCFHDARNNINRWRFRVGSSFASSGGVVHNCNRILIYPRYNRPILDNDIALLRSATRFTFNNNVRAARIAGPNYNPGDNQVVWAAGWGQTEFASSSEQLRHVQVFTINQHVCRQRYASVGNTVTDAMLCSGVLDVGGRDQCQGDSGGPLYHNGVVVGVTSWGRGCALAFFPGVNARVSRFTNWISANS